MSVTFRLTAPADPADVSITKQAEVVFESTVGARVLGILGLGCDVKQQLRGCEGGNAFSKRLKNAMSVQACGYVRTIDGSVMLTEKERATLDQLCDLSSLTILSQTYKTSICWR